MAYRTRTHTLYRGRNVHVHSQRMRKIVEWEGKESEKRRRRVFKRETGDRFAIVPKPSAAASVAA